MYFFATISLRNELDDDDYHCFFALLPLKQIMIYKIYHIRSIISRDLYIFYPIFHRGLYCRAVYNAERLTFHDLFLEQK